MSEPKKILIVVTSHGQLGETGKPTGFFYEELATPYWAFVDAGLTVDIASIRGGKAPYDPRSLAEEGKRPASVQRFLDDPVALGKINDTLAVDKLTADAYDAVFLPGGHGVMWDFPNSDALGRLVGKAFDDGKLIGAVCHGPAGLLGARRGDGAPLIAGRRVNGFTNAEEEAVQLTEVVPFLLETRLREQGGRYECGDKFTPFAVRDGNLVTGQNPMSSEKVATAMIEALRATAAA